MKIKKAHIIAFLCLVAALSATGAVYQFYVKERMRELAEHQSEQKKLENKIKILSDQFQSTKPSVVLAEWRGGAQPWQETVIRRTKFFDLGDLPLDVTVPENETPKFYYRGIYPEKLSYLQNEAYRNGTRLVVNFGSGVPTADDMAGKNPGPDEVSEWLTTIEAYTSIAKLLIDANAIVVNDIAMWPPRRGPKGGRSGHVELRTVGLNFTILMKDFVNFLDDLKHRNRYFNVDGFWIHNQSLRNPGAPIQIQMLLTQARFVPRQSGGGALGGGEGIDTTNAFSTNNFGAGLNLAFANFASGAGSERRTQQKPGLFERLLGFVGL